MTRDGAHEIVELLRRDGLDLGRRRRGELEGGIERADLLVGVTSFFRDAAAFNALEEALRRLEPRGDVVRAWVAGCATGEEAYSVAMCLDEALGGAPYRIFATDVDADAVCRARRAVYPRSIARDVPADRLARWFAPHPDGYQVRRELRDAIAFAPHDLASDPPFSRLDLVTCRNVLIYLEPLRQRRALRAFQYALEPGGLLLLGSSESAVAGDFALADRTARLYVRTGAWRAGAASAPTPERPARVGAPGERPRERELVALRARLEATLEQLGRVTDELASSREQLRTAKDELRRARDELEAAREELLVAASELQARTAELAQGESELDEVLAASDRPLVIVGPDVTVRRFSPRAASLLGLHATHLGRSASLLDALARAAGHSLRVTPRRGRGAIVEVVAG